MASPSNPTSPPSWLTALNEQQQVRLTEILDAYLCQLESDCAPDRDQLIAAHPDLAEILELYLDQLVDLHYLAGGEPIGGDLTGRWLGDYRLLHEIGRGGMGIVYAAEHRYLDRQAAVKVLPLAATFDSKYVERFRNEARAAAQLDHPNIVPVFTVGAADGIHYFVMRLVHGKSLDQRIAWHRENRTSPPTMSALGQFANVAEALHTAHEYGIVHRDIKPSNLLLDDEGKLWVADFGLARIQDGGALTRTGEMIGTMRYMSPEQASGRIELVDHRTDIYSLGAALYELLTNQPAIPGCEGPSLLRTIATQNPMRLRKLRPDLPRDLQVVIEKSMAREREDRYASAQQFADDLRRIGRGEPVAARLVSPLVLAGRWAVKHTLMLSVAAAIAIATTMSIALVRHNMYQQRVEAQAEFRHDLELKRSNTIDQLESIPGAHIVRQGLIRDSIEYYHGFIEQAARDPGIREELPQAYSRLASLHEQIHQTDEAITCFEQADRLFARLAEREVDRHVDRLLYFDNLNKWVLALQAAGRGHVALDVIAEPIQGLRNEHEHSPLTPALATSYGLLENSYGHLLRSGGEYRTAEQAFQNAIDVLAQEHAQSPNDKVVTRGLGAAHYNLGTLRMTYPRDADHRRGLKSLDSALKLQTSLAAADHSHVRSSQELVGTYLAIGGFYLADNQPDRAHQFLDPAVRLARSLVQIAPASDIFRFNLAVALSNLGMARYHQRAFGESERLIQETVGEYEELIDRHADNPHVRAGFGVALNNLAILERRSGNPVAANAALLRASEFLSEEVVHASSLQDAALHGLGSRQKVTRFELSQPSPHHASQFPQSDALGSIVPQDAGIVGRHK